MFNIIYGLNGSGKTAILEALHMLSVGKSFRSRVINQVITFTHDNCAIYADITSQDNVNDPITIGISRGHNSGAVNKINGIKTHSIAEIAQQLPLQIINADSFDVVNASPQNRREFLDWGLFHVEPDFYQCWQRFKRILQQRNASLKERRTGKVGNNMITAWDSELVSSANSLDALRKKYVSQYKPLVTELLQDYMHFTDCNLEYMRGWNHDLDLQQVLDKNLDSDIAAGFTSRGPHRAELEITVNGASAKHFLSRGQMKKAICTMMIARAKLLKQQTGKSCVFLIDDLPAELDNIAGRELITALKTLEVQTIVTGIEKQELHNFLGDEDCKALHVEHGIVYES